MKKASPSTQLSLHQSARPLLIVLSGPSGVGKDAVLARMKGLGYPLHYITTLTTRPRRPNEKNNVDYHFVSLRRFQEMLQNNELLEWAQVYGNWYGVPREAVQQALSEGKDTIVKVDIQGAATIKKILPQAVFIFLMPPSLEDLGLRLKQRHTESPADLALRRQTAEAELEQVALFDYLVVNRSGEIERAIAEIEAIITAERCRVNPREIIL